MGSALQGAHGMCLMAGVERVSCGHISIELGLSSGASASLQTGQCFHASLGCEQGYPQPQRRSNDVVSEDSGW